MNNQGRNIQIAQGQRTKADFNANHYDIEELAAILKEGLENGTIKPEDAERIIFETKMFG